MKKILLLCAMACLLCACEKKDKANYDLTKFIGIYQLHTVEHIPLYDITTHEFVLDYVFNENANMHIKLYQVEDGYLCVEQHNEYHGNTVYAIGPNTLRFDMPSEFYRWEEDWRYLTKRFDFDYFYSDITYNDGELSWDTSVTVYMYDYIDHTEAYSKQHIIHNIATKITN